MNNPFFKVADDRKAVERVVSVILMSPLIVQEKIKSDDVEASSLFSILPNNPAVYGGWWDASACSMPALRSGGRVRA